MVLFSLVLNHPSLTTTISFNENDNEIIIEYSDGTIGKTNSSGGFYKIYHKEET